MRIVWKIVEQMQGGGGNGRVEAQTTTSVKTVKKQGVVNNKKDLNIFGGYDEFFRGLLWTLLRHVNMYKITVIQLWCIRYFV